MKYAQINTNEYPNFNKIEVNVRIEKPAKELELYRLGKEIREKIKYENVYIFYYLPEMKVHNGAYATTHYTENNNGDVTFTGIK